MCSQPSLYAEDKIIQTDPAPSFPKEKIDSSAKRSIDFEEKAMKTVFQKLPIPKAYFEALESQFAYHLF